MKSRRFILASILGLGLALALICILGGSPSRAAPSDELRVCQDGCIYDSVQDAVDAANSGDVIKVAAGTYTGVGVRDEVTQVVYISKTVTVRGGYTSTNWTTSNPEANPTTLDAMGQGRVFSIIGGIDVTLEGLRIIGGDTTTWEGWQIGGGIYALTATLTLKDNWISDNASKQGGGVVAEHSEITLINNRVTSNTAEYGGGGLSLWNCNATLNRNRITTNEAGSLGGAHLHESTGTLTGNTISDNTSEQDAGGLGFYNCEAMLDSNVISGNTGTRYGGGVLWTGGGSDSLMVNNVIVGNQTSGQGSGLYIEGQSSLYLLHNTVAWNSDGGGNGDDIGVYVNVWEPWWGDEYSHVVMTNTLLVGHGVGITVTGGNTVTVSGVLWDSSTPITVSQSPTAVVSIQNQHTGDPAFAADGYHVMDTSDAIDAGVETGLAMDIDGEARPFDVGPDLGADEWAAVTEAVGPVDDSIFTATVDGMDTTVVVPAEAVTEALTLKYTALAQAPGGLEGFSFAGRTFRLEIYRDDHLLPGFDFQEGSPITITIYYADTDVVGMDEETLSLRYWNGSAWVTDGITPVAHNTAQNYVVFTVAHLSQFALFGSDLTADLSIDKVASHRVITAGERITYTITITNAGPTTSTTALVVDSWMPVAAVVGVHAPGCDVDLPGGFVTCTHAALELGTAYLPSPYLVFTTSSTFSGTLINTATITPTGGVKDPDAGRNTAEVEVAVRGEGGHFIYLPLVLRNHQ